MSFKQPSFMPVATDLPLHPKVTWGVLPNGMRYAVMPHQQPPGQVSMRLYVQAGSLMEADDQQGLAHLIEHMAFQGSDHFPNGMVSTLQQLGLYFGADTNAQTGLDSTIYKLDLPNNTEAMLTMGFSAMYDYAAGVHFLEDRLKIERGVVLAEKLQRDTIAYRTEVKYWEFVLKGTRVPLRMPIGLEPVIQNAPRQRLVDFYTDWYRPERMTFVVVGDVDVTSIVRQIEQYLGGIQNSKTPIPTFDFGTLNNKGTLARIHFDKEVTATSVRFQTVKLETADGFYKSDAIQNIYRLITCQMFTERLSKIAKEPNVSILEGATTGFFKHYLGCVTASYLEASCDPSKWEASLSLLEQELRRVLEFGFTQFEFDQAKVRLLKELEQDVKVQPTLWSAQLSEGIVNAIDLQEPYIAPEATLELAKEALSQCTLQELHTVFKSLWEGDNFLIFVSTHASIPGGEAAILKAYSDSNQVAVEAPKAITKPEFAYTQWGAAGSVAERSLVADLNIHQVSFENNVFLTVKQTDFEANTVRVNINFGAGLLETPKDKPGIHAMAQCFIAGGLDLYSYDTLREMFADKNLVLSFGVGPEDFALGAVTTPGDLRDALNLMTSYLMHPGFREEALEQLHKQLDAFYLNLTQTLSGVYSNQGMRFLASGDPRFGFPDKAILSEWTMSDLKQWMQHALTEGTIEVSVVGDVDSEQAIQSVAQTLGALPKRQSHKPPLIKERTVYFPSHTKRVEFPCATQLPKSLVAVAWPTTDKTHIETQRKLVVLREIFTNSMRQKLRDAQGQVYSPIADVSDYCTFPKYGYFVAMTTAPQSEAGAISNDIVAIAEDILQGGISEDQFELAMKPILESIKKSARSNDYWMHVVSGSKQYPEQLNKSRTLLEYMEGLTAKDVYEIAQKYLNPKYSVKIIVAPH